jgi:hypothetical protein
MPQYVSGRRLELVARTHRITASVSICINACEHLTFMDITIPMWNIFVGAMECAAITIFSAAFVVICNFSAVLVVT